jgi:hypothetical protein
MATAVGLAVAVVTACAWWNIHARVGRLMPGDSSLTPGN